jgi:hypothetical protein
MTEEALAAYLWHPRSPSHGYRLAAAYCEHFDPHYGTCLSGPSSLRLEDIVDFVQRREAEEAEGARPTTP